MGKQRKDKSRKYYEYLKTKGVDVAPTYESFVGTLQDDVKREKYYNYLKSQDVDVAPSLTSFTTTLLEKKNLVGSSESESPSQEQGASSVSVGVEPPTTQGDTTAEQGDVAVPDFGEPQEPTESTKSLADDLGISVDQLLTKETIQDPKLVERNLGRPLPTESKYRVDGKPVYRDEMIDVINTNVDKIQAGAIDLEIDDDPELQQRLQRQIEAGGRGGDILESLGAGLVATAQSAEGLKDLAATTVEEITGLPASKTMFAIQSKLNAIDLAKKAEEIRQKTRAYEGNFLESLANGNFVDAAAQGMNLTMESLPITAISAVTGGGGSIGSYLLRSATTLTPLMASREFTESQISKDPDIQELSQSQKVLRSWLFGGAEALGESVTGRIASKNFNLLKGGMKPVVGKAAQEVGEEGAKKTAKQMALQTARDIAKNMGLDMNSEGASEAITEMAQMLTDDLMGTKNFSLGEYAERMSNAYASGAFMGAVMGVGGATGMTADAVKRYRNTSLENIEKGLKTSLSQGEITEQKANEVMLDANSIAQTNPTLSDEAQAQQANLIKERTQLEQFLEGVDKAAAPVQYQRINEINEELTKIAEQDEKVQQEDQELREQEGEVKKEEERIRQEEQARVLEEFDAVEDNETVTITSKTLEEIPEQFRDRAEKVEGVEVETKKTFLGIPYGKAESTTVGDGYRYNATGEEIRNAINQEEQTIVADEKASIKEPVLEELPDGRVQEEGEQESTELRPEEKEEIAKSVGGVRKVKPKNVKGLLDVMSGIFGLNKPQAESAAVVGDVMIETMAKRAGVSKDEMYQRIAYQKAQKAPKGSLKQEAPLTFKSTAKEGLSKIQQKAATPEQWVKGIQDKGGKGTSQELEWIGLEDYLNEWKKENNAKSVPKEVVEQYINDNQIEIVEVSKGMATKSDKFDIKYNNGIFTVTRNGIEEKSFTEEFLANNYIANQQIKKENKETKYSQYTLEGGENYREVLLTLPQEKPASSYKSSHWDETNIVAHLRINERTLPNGERVMFIEEVQSDWAQEGKKKGFSGYSAIQKEINDLIKKEQELLNEAKKYTSKNEDAPSSITDEYTRVTNRRSFLESKDINAVPEMPYKKTDQWVGMAMRRAMQMAAQEGFDRIAWVTGEQSADRYSLKQKVNSISVAPNESGRFVFIDMKGNYDVTLNVDDNGKIIEDKNNLSGQQSFKGKQLEDVVGKDMADKILSQKEENKFEGQGLEVGGEGMKAFYNSILPKVTKKEAQRFDKKANVEVVDVPIEEHYYNKLTGKVRSKAGFTPETSKQLSIPITDKMRMNLNNAVPLFQKEQGAMTVADGKYVVYALTDPNVSTPLHELAHVYEHYLTDKERTDILKWAKAKEWSTDVSEKFARGFEKYLSEGKAPTPMMQKYFDQFKNWLMDIYNGIVGSEIDIELNSKMRSIYDQMLTTQEESLGDLQEQPQAQEKVAPKDEVTVTYEAYNSKGKKVTKQRRGVVESVNDDGSYDIRAREGVYKGVKPIKINKVTKKPTVKSETKGLTEAEQAKQGLEEILAAKESKLAEIKQKLNDKIAQVKEKFKGKLSEEKQKQREDKAAQKELTKIINQEMKELGLGDLRRGRVSRLLSGLKNTKDANFDQQLEKVYDALIQEAKGKRLSQYTKKAKKAAKRVSKSDFGTKANALIPLLRLDPKIIQDQDIVRYTEIVDALTRDGKYRVEDLDLIIDDALEIQQRAEDAIGTLEAEASQVAQGLTEDNFTSSVAKMLEDGVISEKLANFLTKNKRRLLGSESKPINRGQLEYEVKDRAEFVSNNKPEVEDAQVEDAVDTVVSVTQKDLDNLTPQQLSLLNRVLDAMEVGIVPSQVIRVARDITAFREASNIDEELRSQKGVRGKITTLIETPLKTFFDTKRAKTEARVLKSQTPEIDAALGFKGRAIANALRKFNLGYANFLAEKYRNDAQLATLLKGIRKNEESDIKAFMYMAELQSRSNPDSKKVHSVRELVEVLNKDARSRNEFIKIYGEKRLQSINEMLEQFKDEDGDLDVEAVYESMTKAEKKYVDGVRKILDDTTPKARAAAFMRGEPFEEFDNYINYPVVSSMTRDKVNAAVESVMRGGNVNNMSTRSMLKERQVAVPPVSFSLAESVQNSYNETLKDYYLTDPLKTEFSSLSKLSEMAKDEEDMSQVVEGIVDGIRTQRKHLLKTQATQGLNSKLYNQVTEAAYRYLLGSTQRFVAEGLSNASYVLTSDPNAFKEALLLVNKGLDIGEILQNLPTSQRERLMGNAKFMGHADVASTFSEGVDFSVKRKDLDTKAAEALKRAQDWWGLKVPESVPIIGGTKISPKAYQEEIIRAPDRFFARGVFFSAFKRSFKEQTGKSLDLMSLKDKDFVRQNKKVLREAAKMGDRAVRKAFATTNPAERAGAQLKATEGAMGGRFKYFMLNFMINEYEQLRGAYIRDGFVGGASTSLPIMLRFAAYGVIADVVSRMLLAPFTDDDEDIWDILPSSKEFGRSFLSAFVALTIQRNMSNFARVPMNVAIEILNDVFGEGVTREKGDDYNKYSNSVMYNKIDITELDKMSAFEASKVIMPQLSPFIGATETTWKAVDKYLDNKDKMFLSKNKKDLETYYKYKAAIEVLASLGIITKDVRSAYVYYKNKDRIMKRGK